MRKAHILAVALIAALGISAVAIAQSTAQNEYTVSGSTSPTGGTKKKPKAVQLKFGFKTSRPDGTLPAPIEKYSIGFEGAATYTKVVKKKCTAAAMNAAQSDNGCPAGAKVGTGTIKGLAGSTGLPTSSAARCDLKLTVYNGGNNHMPLWLEGTPPDCVATINQAIDAVFVKKPGGVTALDFTVPDSLRHPVQGLDVGVMEVTTTIKKIQGKVGGKKVGFFSSVGCKDKKRDIVVTFTDETGAAVPAKTTLAKC